MSKIVNRGYVPSDKDEFSDDSCVKIIKASKDLYYLINNFYNIKGASTFVGNHYMLSDRQRLALVRGISPSKDLKIRKDKELKCDDLDSRAVNIDGFNTIITLEVALSKSILVRSMDGTLRDLAGLRGTYKIIDKTEIAVNLLFQFLDEKKVRKANIYLDAPVSNSGRLKEFIIKLSEKYNLEIKVETINDVDKVLENLSFVISSDAIILNKCKSWVNINKHIIDSKILECFEIDLSNNYK